MHLCEPITFFLKLRMCFFTKICSLHLRGHYPKILDFLNIDEEVKECSIIKTAITDHSPRNFAVNDILKAFEVAGIVRKQE